MERGDEAKREIAFANAEARKKARGDGDSDVRDTIERGGRERGARGERRQGRGTSRRAPRWVEGGRGRGEKGA